MTTPSIPVERLLEHSEWVRGLARSLVEQAAEADDLVQDAWLAALRNPPRHDDSLRGWLAATMRNIVRNRRRDAYRRDRRERTSAPDEAVPSSGDLVAEAELQARVVRAVVSLDEPYRTTVLLRWFDDLPRREIARVMQVPVQTVATRLARAHERLREKLDEEHGGDRRAWCLALVPLARRAPNAGAGPALATAIASAAAKVVVVAAVLLVATILWWRADDGNGAASQRAPGPAKTAAVLPERSSSAARQTDERENAPPAGRGVDAVVVDASGRPVGGAALALHPIAPWWSSVRAPDFGPPSTALGPPTASARSDGAGRAALRDSGKDWRMLVVTAPGFARRAAPIRLSRDDVASTQSVVLERAASLDGRVLAADGTSPSGAVALATPQGWDRALHALERVETPVGADGRFRLDGLAPGGVVVSIRTADGVQWDVAVVELPSASFLDVRLSATATLTGRVVEAGTDRPVPRAVVGVSISRAIEPLPGPDAFLSASAAAVTGDDGAFRIDALPAGTLDGVSVRAPGFAAHGRSVAGGGFVLHPDFFTFEPGGLTLGSDRPPALAAGASGSIEFRIHRTGTLRGRVLDEDGRPVTDAHVIATVGHSAFAPVTLDPVPTDADGEYRLDAIAPGPVVVGAAAPGLRMTVLDYFRAVQEFEPPAELLVQVPEGGEAVKDLRLVRGSVVEGTVVDADGRPVEGASVALAGSFLAHASVLPAVAARSRADGSFRLEWGVPPRHLATLRASTPSGLVGASATFDIPDRGTARDVRIVVRAPAALAGRVRRTDGADASNAWVAWTPRGVDTSTRDLLAAARNDATRVPVGADGSFRVETSGDDRAVLVAGCDGCALDSLTVTGLRGGEVRQVNLALAPEAVLAGTVLDEGDHPIANVAICCTAVESGGALPPFGRADAVTDAAGRFLVHGFPAGPHLVGARSPGRVPTWTTASAGDAIVLRLLRGAVMRGRVLGEDGRPVAGEEVSVRVTLNPGDRWSIVRVAADGSFATQALDPTEAYELKAFAATANWLWDVRQGVRVGGDEPVLTLRRALRISGRVVDADGRPLGGVPVAADPPAGGDWNAIGAFARSRSRDDGAFEIAGLAPGRFRLRAGAGGSDFVPTLRAELADAGSSDVVLVTRTGATLSGRLVDAEGRALAGATVVARWPAIESAPHAAPDATTDGTGSFGFAACLPPDGVRLVTWSAAEKRWIDLGFQSVPAKDVVLRRPN